MSRRRYTRVFFDHCAQLLGWAFLHCAKRDVKPRRTRVLSRLAGVSPLHLTAPYRIEVVDIIEALIENRNALHIVNTTNHGAIDNMPPDAIVEVDAVVGSYGLRPLHTGPLPAAPAAHLRLHAAVQRLKVETALTGDRRTALQEFQRDPATRSGSLGQ